MMTMMFYVDFRHVNQGKNDGTSRLICFSYFFQTMSATSTASTAGLKLSDSEISKLLNLPLSHVTESNQDVPVSTTKANDSGKSSSQCDNQNFMPKVC